VRWQMTRGCYRRLVTGRATRRVRVCYGAVAQRYNIGSHETGGIRGDDRRGGRPSVACGGLRLRGAVVVVPKASTGHAKREKAGPRQAEPQHQDPVVIAAAAGRELGRRFREYSLVRRYSGRPMQMVSTAISSQGRQPGANEASKLVDECALATFCHLHRSRIASLLPDADHGRPRTDRSDCPRLLTRSEVDASVLIDDYSAYNRDHIYGSSASWTGNPSGIRFAINSTFSLHAHAHLHLHLHLLA